jgi:bifunctional aspartokinase / homoserine dehydrogenase 1
VSGARRRILKFGGTSVGSVEPLRAAVGIVEAALAEAPVVVVVSALAGVTDALEAAVAGASTGWLDVARFTEALRERHLALLRSVARGKPAVVAASAVADRVASLASLLRAAHASGVRPEDRAAVLAAGERLSAQIVAAALRSREVDAAAVDAASIVRTDGASDEAAVDFPATRRLVAEAIAAVPSGRVPVVTGFIGGSTAGATTLLGRGGSDYSAAVLGWALEAERVEIWSDVPGVMSADPRRDAGARTIPWLSYREAAALARAGAKVLHPRTLDPLEPLAIPVFVGRTLEPSGAGTWIGPRQAERPAREEDGTAA